VPAVFLGIFSSVPLLTVLARLFLGRRRFRDYLFWDEGRLGAGHIDGLLRMLTVLAVLVGVSCAVFVGLVLNWYARFAEDEIAIKRFIGLGEEVHPYGDVEQIVLTTHRWSGKQTVPGSNLGLRFRDGRTWSTDQTFRLPEGDERERLLEFLRRKTGLEITEARLLEDLPGW
jgi:hypothetical protein